MRGRRTLRMEQAGKARSVPRKSARNMYEPKGDRPRGASGPKTKSRKKGY